MPLYQITAPNGKTYRIEGPPGASDADVARAVLAQFPDAGEPSAPKESTIGSELVRGAKQLASTTRTGIGALTSPEEAARAGVERSQQIAAEAGEGPSFAALRKAYEERGLLPAAGELASQIPRAVAGQLPQLAAMAGGAKLGAMAGAGVGSVVPVVGTGLGAIAGGVLGAGATLLPQFFGANVERQAAEQLERGEPIKIDRGTAAAAAAGQAGIEAAGTALVLGKRVVKGILGVTDDAALATAKAREELVKAAGRSRLGAAGRGAAVGLAEIPVEVAQAVIERAQAGLDVLSPEALSEYGENAYLAGLVGPTIGAATRVTEPGAAKRKLAVEEQAKEAEARAAAAKAEEERKKSPEYLLDLDTQYNEAVAKMRELQTAVKQKPAKDADPAQWEEYKQKVAELKDFTANTMRPITAEYTPRKAEIAKLKAEQAAQADTAAAEFEAAATREVPQETQALPYFESTQATLPGMEAAETAPAPQAEEEVDYAKQVVDLKGYLEDLQTQAQSTTNLEAKRKLSQDYARAEAALKEATRLAKASGQDGKALDRLRKQMATAEERRDLAAQGRIAERLMGMGVTDLGAQGELDLGKPQELSKIPVPTDLADYEAAKKREAEEKAARDEQRRQQQQLAKEAYERSQQGAGVYADVLAAAQRRAAERAAAEAEAQAETQRTQREEDLVGQLVEATGAVQPQPIPQARMALPARETTESLYDQAAELRAQLAFAQQTRNKNLEARILRQLQQIGASPEEKGSALDLGTTAREAGVEGKLPPDALEQNRLLRLGQRQLMSYDQLVNFITKARDAEQKTVDEQTKARYKYRAEQLKQAAIGFALLEINGRRKQYGLAPLEHKDAMRAITGLARPLNELIARGAQMFEEPVVVRGQPRGIRLVDGAQEFERPPAGRRTFSEAGFPAAADTLREQFRQMVETISGAPQKAPALPYAKPPGPSRRVVPEQRELFLTPSPAEEPVSLAPEGFFAKGVDKAASSEDAQLLRQMQEIYTELTPQQQSVVREQAQRAADGKPLDAVYEMRGLYQMRQRESATAAGQQSFLKPITLVTARRKIESLAQKAAALEKDVREKLETLLRMGVTRGVPELEKRLETAEAKAFVARVEAGRKTDIARAKAAFDRARAQGADLITTATQLRAEQTKERQENAARIAQLEQRQRELDKEWDDVVADQFGYLQTRYQFLRDELAAGRAPKTNAAELAQLEKLIPGAADRVVKTSKALDKVNKQIADAKAAYQSVLERQAADTVTASLLKEANKAQDKIEAAQKKLDDARAAEKAAERVHKATVASAPSAPTQLQQIEAMPIKGVTRVFRDVDAPEVQAQATKKRSAIAREEGTYAILEERAKAAEGDERAALKQKLSESEARIQKIYDELYDVYSNAPLKRVEGPTVEAAASAERLEKARHDVYSAEIDAFNAKHDTARISLRPRKAGPIISEKGVVKQGGERVVREEPATPIASLVNTRKRIDEINQQLQYIKKNPAQSEEGKTRQAKVKEKLISERQGLAETLRGLLQKQRQVTQEEKAVAREVRRAGSVSRGAIRQTKLEATDAQLFEDLADAKLSTEQRQLFERAQNVFGEMSAPEQALVRRQANALIGRRESDYKADALTNVVSAAERRRAREDDSGALLFPREAGPQYETRDLTDLTPAALEAVKDGDIRTALADLEKNGSTQFVRDLAKRLGDMTMRTRLEVSDNVKYQGDTVEGLYDSAENKVLLHSSSLSEETLTHELTHAATMRALEADPATLTPEQRAARREIEAMHAAIQKQPDFVREYGRKDVKEFVSELMSNASFRNKLDAQKPSFIRRIYDAFMRLLGFPRTLPSAQAVKATYALFMPAQKLKAASAASARRGAPGLSTANRVADSLIAKEKGWVDKLRDNFLGAGFRTQFIDKLYPTEEALRKGGTDPTKALQAMYYLRMHDQRMHFTSQSVIEGVPELATKTRRDGQTERVIETKPGANILKIMNILKGKDVVKEAGSPDAANKLFTLYLSARRADSKGYDKLNFKVKEADIKAARAEIEANPTLKKAFDEARDIYNQYNRNLLEFSVQTGAMSRELANKLLAENDYIPYYRMRDGVAELIIGGEMPVRIGNLKDSPHLKELVGGDEAIFDFLTSSVQNTSMLLDMATRNLAVKNLMFEFRDVGLATVAKVPKSGKTPEGAVTFKRDGEDYFAVVDTDTLGINSDLLVKGLAGIPTMFPSIIRVLGVPARILRRLVVASPVYMARQLFRDTLAATLTSGADMVPVMSALKQIGKPKALQSRGITGGQVFTGMPEDQTRILKDMQAGKISLTNGLAWLEAKSAQLDALTREAQYASYREQGLSEMEATLMALESMNFSKRGLSPTIHMASTIIPFFNAQIQGLDVLYKAFAGKMPLNERLAIREKLWTRGMMLFGLSAAYAMAMQDDEAYQNASPEEKYGNWFVRIPGVEQPVRLPIPFELGYIFKALPEAMVNIMMNDKGGEEAGKAFKHIVTQMVPGLSSYFLPQAVKPGLEALIGTSLYTQRSIESGQEQMMEPGFRYRDNTTALAREVGELTGFSPIKMEFLIRGYFGTLGMTALAALSAPLGSSGPEGAEKRLSDLPLVGTIFQPNDASGIINATYERMKQINTVKETYEGLLEKGRTADAEKYLRENINEMSLASVAGNFRQTMGEITKYENAIKASNMSPEEKRQQLDQMRQLKIQIAKAVRELAGKKEPQSVPA